MAVWCGLLYCGVVWCAVIAGIWLILNTTRARPPALGSGVTVATGTSDYTHTHTLTDTQSNTNTEIVMSDTELDDNKSEILDVCEDDNITEDEVKF